MIDLGVALLASFGVVSHVALFALIVGAIVWWAVPPSRNALVGVRDTLARAGVWMAWFVAFVATAGSLWLSEVAEFVPCGLCWWQRYVMYPFVILLLVAAIMRRWWITAVMALIAVLGLGISSYHVWLENNPHVVPTSCRQGVPCSVKWMDEFGYITIPTLAGTAFILIAVLSAFAAYEQFRRSRADSFGP